MDVDALADTLDFEGPPNTVFVLQPQVRYTWPPTGNQSLAFAIEKPTTEWSQYASANVIFAPTSSFSVGAEVLYGWQEVKSGERGNATRVQVSLQYDLVRR